MLAQSFQSAADLGISEPQKDALIKTLVLLEAGKLEHRPLPSCLRIGTMSSPFSGEFNMAAYIDQHDCGTVACILGTASIIGNVAFHSTAGSSQLSALACGHGCPLTLNDIRPEHAAIALRNYLTTGDAKWAEAVSA